MGKPGSWDTCSLWGTFSYLRCCCSGGFRTFVFYSRNREVLGALPQHFTAFCIAQIHPVSDTEVKSPQRKKETSQLTVTWLASTWPSAATSRRQQTNLQTHETRVAEASAWAWASA